MALFVGHKNRKEFNRKSLEGVELTQNGRQNELAMQALAEGAHRIGTDFILSKELPDSPKNASVEYFFKGDPAESLGLSLSA